LLPQVRDNQQNDDAVKEIEDKIRSAEVSMTSASQNQCNVL